MVDTIKLEGLVRISRAIGADPAMVQGGGGNTSVKVDDTRMAIKASGYRLIDIKSTDGFAVVNYPDIRRYLESPNVDEDSFTAAIKSRTISIDGMPMLRASIETGFHALLGAFVAHSHSVYANVLTCAVEGSQIARALFPDAVWVDYASPGQALTLRVRKAVCDDYEGIVFLQNHGMIVSGPSADAVIDLHAEVNRVIISKLSCENLFEDDRVPEDLGKVRTHVLFPDQVVYTLSEETAHTVAARQTLSAYRYICETIHAAGLSPRFLSAEEAGYIESMESEKYRKGIVK